MVDDWRVVDLRRHPHDELRRRTTAVLRSSRPKRSNQSTGRISLTTQIKEIGFREKERRGGDWIREARRERQQDAGADRCRIDATRGRLVTEVVLMRMDCCGSSRHQFTFIAGGDVRSSAR